MNLVLLHNDDFVTDNRVRLMGRRHLHSLEILKVTIGKQLQVGLLGGNRGIGTVVSIDPFAMELDVELQQEPPPAMPIKIILAMPRPKVFKRVLQGLTAFGVKNIHILNSWRVDKSYWQSPLLEPEAIRENIMLGLEQSCDTILPEVHLQKRFKPFVEDTLPHLATGTFAFLAHPGSTEECPADVSGAVTLAIGPEGGFTRYEVEKLSAAGLTSVRLGCRPLRVESAVSALVGRLMPCL